MDNFGIDKITEVINKIHDSGNILEDLSRSNFVAHLKKSGANECNHLNEPHNQANNSDFSESEEKQN